MSEPEGAAVADVAIRTGAAVVSDSLTGGGGMGMWPDYERMLEDVESGEEVHVISRLTAPVEGRDGEEREAMALIVATPGCYYRDTVDAFKEAIAEAESVLRNRDAGWDERIAAAEALDALGSTQPA